MPKIANVIEEARLGGPQIRISEVAKKLLTTEFKTTVIIPRVENFRFKERLFVYGLDYEELPLYRLSKQGKQFFTFTVFFVYEIFILRRFLKKGQFEIVHVSGGSWQWKGVVAGKLAGCKVLWHLNDTQMPVYIRFIFKPLAKYFADGFIVAGHRVKNYYLKQLKISKPIVDIIQAPVDCSVFSPDLVEIDPKLDAIDGVKVVTVANINPVKGLETFIHMAAEVKKSYKDVSFIIVGPVYSSQKKYYERLKALVCECNLENSIHFYGPTDDVTNVLKSADIYVCSSLAEASPVSVWEALAMEKPVVSTDVGDVGYIIKSGDNGFIVDVKDHCAMAKQVNGLIESPQQRLSIGKKARLTALAQLDVNVIAAQHKEVYRKVLET